MTSQLQREQSGGIEKKGTQPPLPSGVGRAKASTARSIQKYITGQVSRTTLLTTLLPLSFASLFGALIVAAFLFPKNYSWQVNVISALTSPRNNPQGCWLASLGIMAAMLLVVPFAGYLAERLRAAAPRLARWAGLAFALSFVTMTFALLAQLAQPFVGPRWLHELLARAAAGSFIVMMFCCAACAIKERRRGFGRQASLPAALAYAWGTLTLLPLGCVAVIGILVLLGHQGGQTWAENFRQSFRQTPLWHLAFWEWIGIGIAFVFLTVSALLLPANSGKRRTVSDQSFLPDETAMGPFLPQPDRPL